MVFAESWTDEDPFEQFRKKSAICAEALVPDVVRPELIIGAYVSCAASVDAVRAIADCRTTLDIAANPHIFFL